MVRKKKRQDNNKLECWYCQRQFDDEHTMVTHMRAKHFKCATCKKKLNTANGLKIHLFSVHNQSLQRVPNAIAGRDSIDADADAAAAGVQIDDANDNNNDDDSDAPANDASADPNDPKRPRTAATAAALATPLPPSMMLGMHGFGIPHPGMLGMPPMGMMGMGLGLPPGFVPQPVSAAAAAAAAAAAVAVPAATTAATTTSVATSDGNVLSAAATMAPTDAPSTSHLVYDDENEQMEEKRAQLRKHAVVVDSA